MCVCVSSTPSNKTKKMFIVGVKGKKKQSLWPRIKVFREIVHFLFYLGNAQNGYSPSYLPSSGIF